VAVYSYPKKDTVPSEAASFFSQKPAGRKTTDPLIFLLSPYFACGLFDADFRRFSLSGRLLPAAIRQIEALSPYPPYSIIQQGAMFLYERLNNSITPFKETLNFKEKGKKAF